MNNFFDTKIDCNALLLSKIESLIVFFIVFPCKFRQFSFLE